MAHNDQNEVRFSTFEKLHQYNQKLDNVNKTINSISNNQLYPVKALPEKYRHIFSNYAYFNKIQTKAINTILYTDRSVVISSPTGSGKTVIFELAIIRFLETLNNLPNILEESKIIYVAPIKSLCSERYEDWKKKFSIHGLKCVEMTGDSKFSDDMSLISSNQLIITTPEKLDSVMRNYKESTNQLYMVKLFLIDGVHIINESFRGATLEAIISRMKIKNVKIAKSNDLLLRFVAVSATVSNNEDIAKWLTSDLNFPTYCIKSNEDERTVKLQKIVIGYKYNPSSFKFDLDLTYKLKPLIKQYSNGRPTLIFCSTRKSVEFTCSILLKDLKISLCDDKKRSINEFPKEVNNTKIKELLKHGIGCYHAGMNIYERSYVENLFRIGCLDILVATSTLAMGVNLPAHLVIIKSTEYYTFNTYKEYNETQVLQMIGRAGRSQFDTTATVIIMTKSSMKSHYENILIADQIVESHLHEHLIEHLNTEIFLGTIDSLTVVIEWIRSTFLYVRACKFPQNYGMTKTNNVNEIEHKLKNLYLTELKLLACTGLINFLDENKISSKPEGRIMAKYSISFATINSYMHLKGDENVNDLIRLLACSKEFDSIKLRRTEKGMLNILNKNKSMDANVIRFPIDEGINTKEAKINCLLQATLGTLKITNKLLAQDANKIILISIRLTKVLKEITFRGSKFKVARVASILAKCVTTRLWEQSKFVSKLIPKVGPVLSGDFVLNGKTTLQSIRDTDPRDLERFLNRQPPFGNHVHNFIRQIPKYKIWVSFDEYLELITLKTTLINHENISKNIKLQSITILIGDTENRLLKVQNLHNEEFVERGGTINMNLSLKNILFSDTPDYTVIVCLISDQWVGIDIEIKLKLSNREEHIKEMMSEENCIQESPSKYIPSPRSKRPSRIAKQTKIDKPQFSIKTYLHNVSLKDQDPKVVNKLLTEEDKDNIKNDAIISCIATQKNNDEAPTTVSINGQINEFFKFDKDNLNKYFYYDELINDDVLSDLFVPETNVYDISNMFDSTIKKRCLSENSYHTKYLKNKIGPEVFEHAQLQCSKIDPLVKKLENNNLKISNEVFGRASSTNFNISNQTVQDNVIRCSKDELEDKENISPYKPVPIKRCNPFDIRQENTSKRLQKLMTPPTKMFKVKKSNFTSGDRFKSVKPIFNVFPSSLNNPVTCEPDTTNSSEANLTARGPKPINSIVTSGLLSQRIEANLKSTSDFYSHLNVDNLSETVDSCHEKYNTKLGGCGRTVPGENSEASIWSESNHHRTPKTMLGKYFRAATISRHLGNLSTDKLNKVASKNDPTKKLIGGERHLNALRVDSITQSSNACLQSQQQLKKSLGIDKLFAQHFPNNVYNKKNSEKSPVTAIGKDITSSQRLQNEKTIDKKDQLIRGINRFEMNYKLSKEL